MHDGPVFREHHINELSAALARMLHMHHILLERTRYRENIHDAECIREIHEAPCRLSASGKIQTHKIIRLFYVEPDFLALIPFNVSSGDARQPTLAVHSQAFRTEKACRDAFTALKNVGNLLSVASASPPENKQDMRNRSPL